MCAVVLFSTHFAACQDRCLCCAVLCCAVLCCAVLCCAVHAVPAVLMTDGHAGTYKASLMQAFERTVKEARFGMVLVDAPNVSADDLKGYWSAGQVTAHHCCSASPRFLVHQAMLTTM